MAGDSSDRIDGRGKRKGMAHRWVQVHGLRLHSVEAGTDPWWCSCTASRGFWHAWRHQILALADAGYRVVARLARLQHLCQAAPGA
jgi:hypothetical protein